VGDHNRGQVARENEVGQQRNLVFHQRQDLGVSAEELYDLPERIFLGPAEIGCANRGVVYKPGEHHVAEVAPKSITPVRRLTSLLSTSTLLGFMSL
jgi:hypothetical protein